MESLYDQEDNKSVYCFPGEIYASRVTSNPYSTLKTRTYHPKQTSSRVHRVDSYEYKKLPSQDEDSFNLTHLRRKSLSSCDLFHVTSKTLTSPFDEIQNWISNKRKKLLYYTSNECSFLSPLSVDSTTNNQEKMNADEFELIQLAMIHLSSSNRQFLYVIIYFLTQCVRNKQFCSNETNKLRVRESISARLKITLNGFSLLLMSRFIGVLRNC